MQKFLLILNLSLFLVSTHAFPVVCLDPTLELVVSTNCTDLRIFKLSNDLCSSVYQPLDIDLSQTEAFSFFDIQLKGGFLLSHLAKSEIESIPILQQIVSGFCPNFTTLLGGDLDGLLSSDSVYLELMDASEVQGSDDKADGTEQYFDNAKEIHEYEFQGLPNLDWQDLAKGLNLAQNVDDLTVVASKLYWRFMTYLPTDKIHVEMQEAASNPLHTPSLYWCFLYFVMKIAIPVELKYAIRHEILEVCLRNEEDQSTYHFIIDRGAKVIPDFHSQIRIIYSGKGDGCQLNSSQWGDIKAGFYDTNVPQLTLRKGNDGLSYSFNAIIKLTTDYLISWPKYNTLYNCQHFATNTFNLISDDTLDFESSDIMEAHSVTSLADGTKLAFLNLQEIQ